MHYSDKVEGLLYRIRRLNEVGIALSTERDHMRLLEQFLVGAKELTQADGGTLYLMTPDQNLHMEILHTDSLGVRLGGTSGEAVPFAPIPLYLAEGVPNKMSVVTSAVLEARVINIVDAYAVSDYDFQLTHDFDARNGYRSVSFLTVPMKNHENDVIGVLQLINARDRNAGTVIPFHREDQQLVESLASQAAIAISQQQLISEMKALFDSVVKMIARAIDEKSPHTANHCRRIPELTLMLAEAVHATTQGEFAGFNLSDEDRYELEIAAWLHDCGKLTTPDRVIDKSRKLETLFDRIHLVDARFEILRRDAELVALKNILAKNGIEPSTHSAYYEYMDEFQQLAESQAFVREANIGSESMHHSEQARVRELAGRQWTNLEGADQTLLTEDEVRNLCIPKGTLTEEERALVNNHIHVTIKMLGSLPFPKHLKNVPEYAGGHHERVDGAGFPKGLRREEMSVQARVMAIADIFEALTASDRPYKKPMSISSALRILARMAQEGHVDAELFRIFVEEGIYLRYARAFLNPEQIDDFPEELLQFNEG